MPRYIVRTGQSLGAGTPGGPAQPRNPGHMDIGSRHKSRMSLPRIHNKPDGVHMTDGASCLATMDTTSTTNTLGHDLRRILPSTPFLGRPQFPFLPLQSTAPQHNGRTGGHFLNHSWRDRFGQTESSCRNAARQLLLLVANLPHLRLFGACGQSVLEASAAGVNVALKLCVCGAGGVQASRGRDGRSVSSRLWRGRTGALARGDALAARPPRPLRRDGQPRGHGRHEPLHGGAAGRVRRAHGADGGLRVRRDGRVPRRARGLGALASSSVSSRRCPIPFCLTRTWR